jgi:hypothetical protein
MRNLTRVAGTLFAAATIAAVVAPAAGATTTTAVPSSVAFNTAERPDAYANPCEIRLFRYNHPEQCGIDPDSLSGSDDRSSGYYDNLYDGDSDGYYDNGYLGDSSGNFHRYGGNFGHRDSRGGGNIHGGNFRGGDFHRGNVGGGNVRGGNSSRGADLPGGGHR